MTPSHLDILIKLARVGLAHHLEKAPGDAIVDAARAIVAAESYKLVLENKEGAPPPPINK